MREKKRKKNITETVMETSEVLLKMIQKYNISIDRSGVSIAPDRMSLE